MRGDLERQSKIKPAAGQSLWMKTGRKDWDRVGGRKTGKQASVRDVNIGPVRWQKFDRNCLKTLTQLQTYTHTESKRNVISAQWNKCFSRYVCVSLIYQPLLCRMACIPMEKFQVIQEKNRRTLVNNSPVKQKESEHTNKLKLSAWGSYHLLPQLK